MKDKLQLAYEYLEATGVGPLFEAQLNDTLFKIACDAPPEKADDVKKLKKILVWENVAKVLAQTVSEEMPERCIQGFIDFYKTEPGVYMREHLVELTEKLQKSLNTFLEEKISELD